jgi:glycosyltransferase involved in cell wall biosynthesis
MNETPLVSVIIPCYKQARYLPTAIDSALSQTYAPIEVLVVNDDSPDETEQVARSYGDRIVYLHQSNRGVSAARNRGIARAQGRYFKFLDADDHLYSEQIAWQVGALAGLDDAVSLTATRLYRDGRPEEYLDHIPEARALLPDLLRPYDWGAPIAWLAPASLVRAVGGFDESLRVAEDWDFFLRLGLHGARLVVDRRIGCYYRQRAGSLSANRPAWVAAQARILLALHDRLVERGHPDKLALDLLKAEQGVYQGLVMLKIRERDLLDPLLARIRELQRRVGFGQFGWRFRLMARCLGYARAERLRSFLVRVLRIRPPATLDTQDWRYAT